MLFQEGGSVANQVKVNLDVVLNQLIKEPGALIFLKKLWQQANY